MIRLVVSALVILFPAASFASDYAVVVSSATHSRPEWKKVVTALTEKHEGATTFVWNKNVSEVLNELAEQHPRFTCFVAAPEEAGRDFVADVHRLTRHYDDDPYADTIWGILTGYDAANALQIAQQKNPLTVRNVSSGTEVALEMCSRGVWFDELVKHKTVSKSEGATPKQNKGPADTTQALADTLTKNDADLFVTSGHATERDWQIGYSYRNGQFRSQNGRMFGVPLTGDRFEIQSDNPKVYLPIGNCLMGHIDGPDAMALAWMNSVGVRQMIGYTVVTWYGYSGWGVLDYFVEQPGRYTLSEAFHANQHALIHRLNTYFDGAADVEVSVGARNVPALRPNAAGLLQRLTPNDARGLLWDRDVVAFYGDPAWEARMKSDTCAYGQTLTVDGDTYTLTIIPKRGPRSFHPVNTNGAQRGWRPVVQFLDHRIGGVKVISGDDLQPVITDDFILVPNPRECDPNREYKVVFTAEKLK